MTRDEYEQFYENALRTLDLFGVRVGKPFTRDGKRYCAINRIPKNDREVFFTTWGRDRANLLIQGLGDRAGRGQQRQEGLLQCQD